MTPSDLQTFGNRDKILHPDLVTHNHVFNPRPADPRIIKTRLNRQHLSRFQRSTFCNRGYS